MGRKKKTNTDNKTNKMYVEREIADIGELAKVIDGMFELACRIADPYNDRPDNDREVAILMGLRFHIDGLFHRKLYALADSISDGDKKNDRPVKS